MEHQIHEGRLGEVVEEVHERQDDGELWRRADKISQRSINTDLNITNGFQKVIDWTFLCYTCIDREEEGASLYLHVPSKIYAN
jgi:hypothetical protein